MLMHAADRHDDRAGRRLAGGGTRVAKAQHGHRRARKKKSGEQHPGDDQELVHAARASSFGRLLARLVAPPSKMLKPVRMRFVFVLAFMAFLTNAADAADPQAGEAVSSSPRTPSMCESVRETATDPACFEDCIDRIRANFLPAAVQELGAQEWGVLCLRQFCAVTRNKVLPTRNLSTYVVIRLPQAQHQKYGLGVSYLRGASRCRRLRSCCRFI